MNILDIIEKKKKRRVLTRGEIEYFVKGATDGTIPDYQLASLLMAINLRGMNPREIYDLTIAMRDSGETLDLSSIGRKIIDKHSTGGVGDKTTLIFGPIMASLGVPIAKMSGRGLGITGGTIDKLDSIPGFSSDLTEKQFIENVNKVGMVDAAQNKNLAPADKILYALRDVTATVDSIALIASSIMSKKLASGADAFVLDVKYGSGAFMKSREDAELLAGTMMAITEKAGKDCYAVISDMNEPLGFCVGNQLEVEEAVRFLCGKKQNPILKELILELCTRAYELSDMYENGVEVRKLIMEELDSGRAFKKFKEFVAAQGGDVSFIDRIAESSEDNVGYKGRKITLRLREISADVRKGVNKNIDAELIGRASLLLGAGRMTKTDKLDLGAGLVFKKCSGERVSEDTEIVDLYAMNNNKINAARELVVDAIQIT